MLLPNPGEENTHALKTICGAVHYCCPRYEKKEISLHDWEYLCSYLNIPASTLYSLEIDNKTLVVPTRTFKLKYVHSDFHAERLLFFI
jgi:hypothetical protein